ncbi:hypothetical protein [Dyadobacter psychrotolerans]|uniref:Outer membrane protein beta-barrel domain-containing protein n=1 Tax=Dyadobacter psychrotolerans TaxID=2541721 RepID=A0A4R5D638_9BACT|nr:hypothetical protein [Dyadobacter psychrotolerans]TDE08846.1 hypothetical protein E0F88_31870 [Dyadobacter psychrotolerans]
MKKTLLMLCVATILSLASEKAFAQFEKGDKILNVGIGGGGYGFYGGGFAVGGSFEVGVHEFISVGAQADLNFYNYSYGFGYAKSNYISVPIAARGSYHYGKHFLTIDKLDLYAGPVLGFSIDGNEYYSGTSIVIGVQAGARYYFKPAMGAFAEFSGGSNVIPAKVGLSFKF